MKVYIRENLREIPIFNQMYKLIKAYAEKYGNSEEIDSMADYRYSLRNDHVLRFLNYVIPDEEDETVRNNKITYLASIFYLTKGTYKVLDYILDYDLFQTTGDERGTDTTTEISYSARNISLDIKYIPAPTEEAEDNPAPSGNTGNDPDPVVETAVDTLTPKGYASVDYFKSFYGLYDVIDDRYIEDFILFQQITEDDMFEHDYGKDLIDSFDNGDYSQFGYSMNWNELNFQELTLNARIDITNAIDNSRWIYMVFEVPIPDSDETERVTMLSDFHHNMFYFDVDEDNYRNSRKKLDLTELAKEIQVDMIPEDAERQDPDRDKYALSYEYDVYIFTYDRHFIHISNNTYYRFHQSFDVYWKLVYYREFNEEYEVNTAGT